MNSRQCSEGLYLPSAAAIIEDHPVSSFGIRLMPVDAAAIGTVNAVAREPATRRGASELMARGEVDHSWLNVGS